MSLNGVGSFITIRMVIPKKPALSCPERFLKPVIALDHRKKIALPKSDNEASDLVNTDRDSLFQSWTAKSEKRA